MRQAEIGVFLKEKYICLSAMNHEGEFLHTQRGRESKRLAALKLLRAAGDPSTRSGFCTNIWHLVLHLMMEEWPLMTPLVGAEDIGAELWQGSLALLKLLQSLMGSFSVRKEINVQAIYHNQIIKHLKVTLKGMTLRLMHIPQLAAQKHISGPNC